MSRASRREFLTQATIGASAAGAIAGVASAQEPGNRPGRRVIGGSPIPVFSRAVAFDRIVFVSGVLGNKPGTRELVSNDFEPQCRQALENLKASVEAAGSRMEQVLKCTCFLTEQADFATFNEIYRTFFPTDPPARSTVVAKDLVLPGAKIELDCVTCLP